MMSAATRFSSSPATANGEQNIPVSAGNIDKTIEAINKKYDDKQIIIAADNDKSKTVNVGIQAAEKASLKYENVSFITPKRQGKLFDGDFNDLVSKNKDRSKERILKEIAGNVKSKVKEIGNLKDTSKEQTMLTKENKQQGRTIVTKDGTIIAKRIIF